MYIFFLLRAIKLLSLLQVEILVLFDFLLGCANLTLGNGGLKG